LKHLLNVLMRVVRIALAIYCACPANPLPAATAAELKNRGLHLMDQGRIKDAIAAFREAHELDPRDAEILNDFGVALRKD
jgi:Flp pilus assembly protein TadD